jgi:hypothetical protein
MTTPDSTKAITRMKWLIVALLLSCVVYYWAPHASYHEYPQPNGDMLVQRDETWTYYYGSEGVKAYAEESRK